MHLWEETQVEPPSIKPDELDPAKWPEWSQHFLTYLSHVNGIRTAPLDYVLWFQPPLQPSPP